MKPTAVHNLWLCYDAAEEITYEHYIRKIEKSCRAPVVDSATTDYEAYDHYNLAMTNTRILL